MLKIVKRKSQSALITLFLAIFAYGFILFDNRELILYGLIPVYSVGIFCGGVSSIGIDYILKSSNYRFIFSLTLHILVVIIVQNIFLIDQFWEPFLVLFLPVGIGFFLIDEILRSRLSKEVI